MASLGYAGVLVWQNAHNYAHPIAGKLVLAGMAVWTALAVALYSARRFRAWPLLGADLVIGLAALLSTRLIEQTDRIEHNVPTLTVSWSVAPLLAWAIFGGVTAGLAAASIHVVATITERGALPQPTFQSCVLLILSGLVIGYVSTLTRQAQDTLARAVSLESATQERERLARRIHDSVLQTLALVHRRGAEAGGVASELAQLAATSEAQLRELVQSNGVEAPPGTLLLRQALHEEAVRTPDVEVTLSSAADQIVLPAHVVEEVAAAVRQALDNVVKHAGAGAHAWISIESAATDVVVCVRDDGVGMSEARAARAEASGRMGLAQSIRGRIRDLGGSVDVRTAPGAGVEIEMRVPR